MAFQERTPCVLHHEAQITRHGYQGAPKQHHLSPKQRPCADKVKHERGLTWIGRLSLGRVESTAIMRRRSSTMSTQICSPIPGRCTFRATSSPVLLNLPLYTCKHVTRNVCSSISSTQLPPPCTKSCPPACTTYLGHAWHSLLAPPYKGYQCSLSRLAASSGSGILLGT